MKTSKLLSVTAIVSASLASSHALAAPIALIDLQAAPPYGIQGYQATNQSPADFSSNGVAEDLSGGVVDYFQTADANVHVAGFSGNVDLDFVATGGATGNPYQGSFVWGTVTNNPNPGDREQLSVMARDGFFLSASHTGPTDVTISNISIQAGKTYKLYLWGTNDHLNNGQEAVITFNGVSQTTNGGANADVATVFTFDSTDADVTGTSLTFEWSRPGTGGSALNAIAVTEVPEPSSLALLGMGGLMMIKRRRRS